MLLEIEEHIAQNTPTFFDYEVKIDKLSQDNLALKMRLKEMENEMLKAKIETMEIQLKANSDYFERKQAEFDAMIECLEDLKSKYTEVMTSSRRLDSELNKLSNIERDIARIKEIDKNRQRAQLMRTLEGICLEPQVTKIRVSFPEPLNSHINKLIEIYNDSQPNNKLSVSQFPVELNTFYDFYATFIYLLRATSSKNSDYKRVVDFLGIAREIEDTNKLRGNEANKNNEKIYTKIIKYVEVINTF